MRRASIALAGLIIAGGGLLSIWSGCVEEARPFFLGGTLGVSRSAGGSVFTVLGPPFTDTLIQSRIFTDGVGVTTATYRARDVNRTALQIDFNGDGRIDPVVTYEQGNMGVIQILLSHGTSPSVNFASLTLDGGDNSWENLKDVAVGDIDGDGLLDIVAAAAEGVIYLHHPDDPQRTHVLSEWGQATGELELVAGTSEELTEEELTSIIEGTLGLSVDLTAYFVEAEEGYANVEIADFDANGTNDILASRSLVVNLNPRPQYSVEPITIVAGSIQLLINPGGARTGEGWIGVPIGQHERHEVFDREGASDLRAADLDGDGDLDVISAATDDQNVQLAWFENPGGAKEFDFSTPWPQHRIGSLPGPTAIDVADLTGDDRLDLVAISKEQMQLVLYVQPEESAARGYDWYSTPIVEFETYEPLTVQALDLDSDGAIEIVIGGSNGALRYFERPLDFVSEWTGVDIVTFDPPGNVGKIGYGDLDGDGDLDLVVVTAGSDPGSNRVSWVRNDLNP